jgi:deoxycytidylate deaminase
MKIDIPLHAEINAIYTYLLSSYNIRLSIINNRINVGSMTLLNKIRDILSNKTITVVREYNGRLRNSKPCSHCAKYMLQLGVKSVEYSDDNGNMIRCNIENLENTVLSRFHMKNYI